MNFWTGIGIGTAVGGLISGITVYALKEKEPPVVIKIDNDTVETLRDTAVVLKDSSQALIEFTKGIEEEVKKEVQKQKQRRDSISRAA